MCGACEAPHARRWTSTRLIPLALAAVLVVLSVAGFVTRTRSSDAGAIGLCSAVAEVAVGYQSAITRDLDNHTRLRADTTRLVEDLLGLGADRCPETRRFLTAAEAPVGGLCPDCVAELRNARASTSSSG